MFLLPLFSLFLFLACQGNVVTPTPGEKTVVVTHSILGAVVRELVADRARIVIAIPDGLDPHEWEPSVKDIEIINRADLVVQNGLGLEAGMMKALQLAREKGVRVFTATDYVSIRYAKGGAENSGGGGAPDPHFWTDPLEMEKVVVTLGREIDYGLGLDVSGEVAKLRDRLGELDASIRRLVATLPEAARQLVTGHESLGYFADRYGFNLVGIIVPALSSQAEVSAADIAAVEMAIRESHVRAIFTELGTSTAVAGIIAKETGVRVVELAVHRLPPDGSYFTLMENLASTIVNALKG